MAKFAYDFKSAEFSRLYYANARTDVIPSVPALGGTLIDIGGGAGATAAQFKILRHADRVGVVDMIKPEAGATIVDFSYSGDLENPQFLAEIIAEEGPFNIILCLDILEHLVDPWRVIAQLHAGTAAGGVIVASIPNVRNYRVILPLLFRNRWTLQDGGILDRTHLRFFVRSTAIELMTSSGLKLESVVASPARRKIIRLLRRLSIGLLNTFIDVQYIIRVRRVD